jgi:hypothetical protein
MFVFGSKVNILTQAENCDLTQVSRAPENSLLVSLFARSRPTTRDEIEPFTSTKDRGEHAKTWDGPIAKCTLQALTLSIPTLL